MALFLINGKDEIEVGINYCNTFSLEARGVRL